MVIELYKFVIAGLLTLGVAIGFALLLVYAEIEVDTEATAIEANIAQHYASYDAAAVWFRSHYPTYAAVGGVDFLVYDGNGKLLHWTNNEVVPALSQFIASPSGVLLVVRGGVLLYKHYRWRWADEEVHVLAYSMVSRTIDTVWNNKTTVYNRALIPVPMRLSVAATAVAVRFHEEVLFYVDTDGTLGYTATFYWVGGVVLVLLFAGGFACVYQLAVLVLRGSSYSVALGVLLVLLCCYRGLMLYANFPSGYYQLGIFADTTLHFEWFFYSLGDALLNVVALYVVLGFMLRHHPRRVGGVGIAYSLVQFCSLVLGFLSFYLFADGIQIILAHSQISLDISSSLAFSFERLSAFLLLALLGIIYFLLSHFIFEYLGVQSMPVTRFVALLLGAMLLSGMLMMGYPHIGLVLISHVGYYLLLYFSSFPAKFHRLGFDCIYYLIATAILLSCTGSFLIFHSFENKERDKMQRFATSLQFDRDLVGEYQLSTLLRRIEGDVILNGKMLRPQAQRLSIFRRIQRTYLGDYFNDYEIDIAIFDAHGMPVHGIDRGQSIAAWRAEYDSVLYQTGYSNVFAAIAPAPTSRRKFVCFATLSRYGNVTGHLMLTLRLKKYVGKRVLPRLLMNKRPSSHPPYAYSIYQSDTLIYQSGDFDYQSAFAFAWFGQQVLYEKGITDHGFVHLGVKVGDKRIVVSHQVYAFGRIISNASFLFSLFLFLAGIALVYSYLFYPTAVSPLSISSKILLYTGASFIVPLLLVGVAVLTTTDRSNRREIDQSNLKSAQLLSESLKDDLYAFALGRMNNEALADKVAELSSHASMDINLYHLKGRLLASSFPSIFESHIISPYLAATAVHQLLVHHKASITLAESIGDYQYKSSYVGIRSSDTGQLLGVVAIPYFSSKNHLKRQQLAVFGNLINIFTFVFIVSIVLASYVISRITHPIVAIAYRLHDTGFEADNEPIEWHTEDEIGTLVQEYNNMLGKLEQSKLALSKNEKEAAWREMAKQVAHEIKNPLTPMKLTIQHLQRLLHGKLENTKSLDILLSQIDTLDEIVTSFSHFANMPTPLNAPFDIGKALVVSIDLHVDKAIESHISECNCYVLGDAKLFGRVFHNLILNAFEAMKDMDMPILEVTLSVANSQVLIAFSDHGVGIAHVLADKVFEPSFTTKDTGLGIGLAVAKRAILHAGGEIWFDTQVGKGTVFFIRMPLLDAEA